MAQGAATVKEPQSVTLELPLPPRRCQANGPHCHWAVKAKARKQYRQEAWAAAREQHAQPLEGRVCLSVVMYGAVKRGDGRYRPTDPDGLIGAMKGAIDGLVDAGVLVDDNAKCLRWGDVTIIGAKESAGRACVVVTLTEEAS